MAIKIILGVLFFVLVGVIDFFDSLMGTQLSADHAGFYAIIAHKVMYMILGMLMVKIPSALRKTEEPTSEEESNSTIP